MLDPRVAQPYHGHPRWDHGIASQFYYDVGLLRNVSAHSVIGGTIEAGGHHR